MKTLIELKCVTKVYNLDSIKVEALKSTNLKIKEKEFVSIMGQSGSGKSTLLHLIGVLDIPTFGHLYLDGIDITKIKPKNLARIRGQKIGFVFQFFNLYPTLTAKENVELPMIIHEASKKDMESRSLELLKKAGLEKRASHYPSQLSGGERQRVAIARALANNPQTILADEPTGNLDSKTGCEIMEIFSQLNKEGKTIVMVTHEKDIASYSKRLITVKDGSILKDKKLESDLK